MNSGKNLYKFRCPKEAGYTSIKQSVRADTKKQAIRKLKSRGIKFFVSTGKKVGG